MASKESKEEQSVLDYEALVAQHGEKHLSKVGTAMGPVVIRTPNEGSLDRFMGTYLDGTGAQKIAAAKQLAHDCVIWPSKEEFKIWCREKPGIAILVGNAAERLSGMAEVAEGKG